MALGMNGITVRLAVERAFALRGMRNRGWKYLVGTCHIDVNELYLTDYAWFGRPHHLPRNFPKPPDARFAASRVCKYSGFSEKVEKDISSRWAVLFGAKYASYDGKWKDATVNGTQHLWQAWQVRPGNHDHYWVPLSRKRLYEAIGKWYRCSGRMSVLTIPKGTTLIK